jgi:hypothetical protein
LSCLPSGENTRSLHHFNIYFSHNTNENEQTAQQPTMLTMTRSSNIPAFLALISIVLLLTTTISLVTIGARAFSSLSSSSQTFQNAETALKMEAVVRRYFDGVNNQDSVQIRSCFGQAATIRDVSGVSSNTVSREIQSSTVQAATLVERHMEFVTAHPDAKVEFYYGPEKGRTSAWVVAHWFKTGTWSGDSGGIPAPAGANKPMAVEGQTRFLVDREALKITAMVVTRTFTEWEELLLEKRQADAELSWKTASTKLF